MDPGVDRSNRLGTHRSGWVLTGPTPPGSPGTHHPHPTIPTMTTHRAYSAPVLTSYGDVAAITGFSGHTTEQDVIFTPNGNVHNAGPASEFACEIPNPTSEQCLPGDN